MATLQTRIINKHDTEANWNAATTFIPYVGEIIEYTDLNKIKIGDGVHTVKDLPFVKSSEIHIVTYDDQGGSELVPIGDFNPDYVYGDLDVTGKARFEEDAAVLGSLEVTGDSTLANTSVDGTLSATGAATLSNTTINGTLSASGATTFGGNVTMNGTVKKGNALSLGNLTYTVVAEW